MRRHMILTTVCAGLILSGTMGLAAEDLPKPQAFARYESMMNQSPFALATAANNFAEDRYITRVARTSDGGLVTVTIDCGADTNCKNLLTKAPFDGCHLISIEWSTREQAQ